MVLQSKRYLFRAAARPVVTNSVACRAKRYEIFNRAILAIFVNVVDKNYLRHRIKPAIRATTRIDFPGVALVTAGTPLFERPLHTTCSRAIAVASVWRHKIFAAIQAIATVNRMGCGTALLAAISSRAVCAPLLRQKIPAAMKATKRRQISRAALEFLQSQVMAVDIFSSWIFGLSAAPAKAVSPFHG